MTNRKQNPKGENDELVIKMIINKMGLYKKKIEYLENLFIRIFYL